MAISLLFLTLATVYRSFQVHVQTIERALQVHRFNQVARVALSMMARDLQSTFWPVLSLEQAEAISDEEEEDLEEEEPIGPATSEAVGDQEPYFLVQPIQEAGRPWDRIVFLSQAPAGGPSINQYPWVHAVEYRLAKDQDTGKPVLVRREDLAPGKDIVSGGEEWALSEAVVGFEVLCVSRAGETVKEWDSRVRRSLPTAVLIRLWVGDPSGLSGVPLLYTLRVALPVSAQLLAERSE